MTSNSLPTRRTALKFLASAPMLPLGTLTGSALLTGCASTAAQASAAPFASAMFSPMAAPSLANAAAMASTTVASV